MSTKKGFGFPNPLMNHKEPESVLILPLDTRVSKRSLHPDHAFIHALEHSLIIIPDHICLILRREMNIIKDAESGFDTFSLGISALTIVSSFFTKPLLTSLRRIVYPDLKSLLFLNQFYLQDRHRSNIHYPEIIKSFSLLPDKMRNIDRLDPASFYLGNIKETYQL